MVARIDTAGHQLQNELEEGDKVRLCVEGRDIKGEIQRKDPREESCWVFVEAPDSLLAVYVDVIQKTEPDNIDHYEVDLHKVNESGGEFNWIGTVTSAEKQVENKTSD